MLQDSHAPCLSSFRIKWQFWKCANRGTFFLMFQSKRELFFHWHFYHRSDIYLYLAINWSGFQLRIFSTHFSTTNPFDSQTAAVCPILLFTSTGNGLCWVTQIFFHFSIIPLPSPPPWPTSLVLLRNSYITVTVSHGLALPLWLQIATQASVVAISEKIFFTHRSICFLVFLMGIFTVSEHTLFFTPYLPNIHLFLVAY